MSRDSQKKQETDDRKELATHLQSLITALEDIVFEIDGNQVFKNVWVYDESMLFMPRQAFLGRKVGEVMGPQASLFTVPIAEVVNTGQPRELVYKHIDPSLHEWFRAKIRPVVLSPQPAKCILVLSIQNITQQRLAELALIRFSPSSLRITS